MSLGIDLDPSLLRFAGLRGGSDSALLGRFGLGFRFFGLQWSRRLVNRLDPCAAGVACAGLCGQATAPPLARKRLRAAPFKARYDVEYTAP